MNSTTFGRDRKCRDSQKTNLVELSHSHTVSTTVHPDPGASNVVAGRACQKHSHPFEVVWLAPSSSRHT